MARQIACRECKLPIQGGRKRLRKHWESEHGEKMKALKVWFKKIRDDWNTWKPIKKQYNEDITEGKKQSDFRFRDE